MYQKRGAPWGLLIFALLFLSGIGYILSGLFLIPGLSLETLEDAVMHCMMHPLENWNNKSLVCMGAGFLVWIFLVNYVTYHQRDFHMDTEHGSENWLDVKKAAKELSDKEPKYNRILTEHLRVSLRGGLSNNNMLVIGSSGSYKTTSIMHQNLLQFANGYVVLDVKGDTQYKLGRAMLDAGYTVKSLNFKQPEKSDRYNPFVYIEREDDLLRVIKALHDACRPEGPTAADPFWDDGLNLYLQSLFYYAWLDARERGSMATINDVLALCNLENQHEIDIETEEELSLLQRRMNEKAAQYGDDYPPVRDYRKLKEGAPDTVRSIVIMVNAMLAVCETAEVKRIFSANDINIRELGTGVDGDPKKKVVLFLIIPDNNPVYNFVISMFYTQMFDILIRLSDDELHSPLPVPVEVHMDEFYAGAKPADSDKLLGVVRSRNISMIPYLQSISQIKTLFKDEKWETIMDNVATVVYLGSGPLAEGTHKFISEALGKATIDSRSDNIHRGRNGSSGLNFNRTGRELMTPGEVKRMPTTDAIVFLESRLPVYDSKALPFDIPVKNYTANKFLKERYAKAMGKGEYEHPVYTLYDPVHFCYITVEREKKFQVITDEKEIQTYVEAAKHDPSIYMYNINEDDLLYLSWGNAKHSQEEVEALYKESLEEIQQSKEKWKGLAVLQDTDMNKPDFGTLKTEKTGWENSGSLQRLLIAHWEELSVPEQEEFYRGIDDGLTQEQLFQLMLQPLSSMPAWRRAYALENRMH